METMMSRQLSTTGSSPDYGSMSMPWWPMQMATMEQTPAQKYTVHRVRNRQQLDNLVEVVWASFSEPYRKEFNLIYPVYGTSEQDRLDAIQRDKDRRWESHRSNPYSHWFYVSDDRGQMVAGCQWTIFLHNPYPGGVQRLEATWWPEGEMREFASEFVNQMLFFQQAFMGRPHINLNQLVVLPEHRRRGIGSMLMKWGIEQADTLGLECYVEGAETSGPLFEKFGFKTQFSIVFNPMRGRRNVSDTWKRLIAAHSPGSVFELMWRPAGGVFHPGGPQHPWQVGNNA